VGVAALVRRLAAAVRLDPVADLALRVRRPARLQASLSLHVPVRGLTVHDPIRPDHARVADVDHVAAAHVEADATPCEEHARGANGARQWASRTRKVRHTPSQLGRLLVWLPPNAPLVPRAIFHATCGPVQASVTVPVRSSTRPDAI